MQQCPRTEQSTDSDRASATLSGAQSRNYPSEGQPMEDDSNVLPVPYHVVQSGTPGACYIADAVWQSQCVDDTSQHHLAEVS